MIRDKKITFRVSKEEYKAILKKKPAFISISEYIRRAIL